MPAPLNFSRLIKANRLRCLRLHISSPLTPNFLSDLLYTAWKRVAKKNCCIWIHPCFFLAKSIVQKLLKDHREPHRNWTVMIDSKKDYRDTPTLKKIKAVLVGDNTIGKTVFLQTYTSGRYPPSQLRYNCVDAVHTQLLINNETFSLVLWDTRPSDFDKLRPQRYKDADLIFLCYDVSDPDSLKSCNSNWMPEIQKYGQGKGITVLLGLKSDLRNDRKFLKQLQKKKKALVSSQDIQAFQTKHRIAIQVECSSKAILGIEESINTALRAYDEELTNKKKTPIFNLTFSHKQKRWTSIYHHTFQTRIIQNLKPLTLLLLLREKVVSSPFHKSRLPLDIFKLIVTLSKLVFPKNLKLSLIKKPNWVFIS